MSDNILDDLEQRLRVKGNDRRLVVRELESHLRESQKYLEACGRTPEAAQKEAAVRFGDPTEVAEMLTAVHSQRAPRLRAVAAATLLVAVASAGFGAAGAFAAYGLGPQIPQHHTYHHHNQHGGHAAAGKGRSRLEIHHLPAR